MVEQDEFIRADTTAEKLAGLQARRSSRTAARSPRATRRASTTARPSLVLMTAKEAERRGIKPLARIVSWAQAGVDPAVMGSGPIPASRRALEKAGWKPQDLDLIEANEAFAAQACAVNKDMGWDTSKVNVNGGAIAIGHPIGASGARVLTTLLHEMKRRNAKKGLATLCIGGGMGIALCVERVLEGHVPVASRRRESDGLLVARHLTPCCAYVRLPRSGPRPSSPPRSPPSRTTS